MRYLALVGLVVVVVLAGCMQPDRRGGRGIPSDPGAVLGADGGAVGERDAGAGSSLDVGGRRSPRSDAGAPGAEADAGAAPAVDVPAAGTEERRAAELTQDSWGLLSTCEGLAVAPVYLATALATGWREPRLYGTLTQTSATEFSYAASPVDRLVVIDEGGVRWEAVYRRLDGDFLAALDEFFDESHDVDVSMSASDGTRFTLRSVRTSAGGGASLTGTLPAEVSLSYTFTSHLASAPASRVITLDETETTDGTVASEGVLVDIAHSRESHTVSTETTLTSTSVYRLDDVWTLGSGTHSLSGSITVEDGSALATGTLTLGATRLGTFRVEHTTDGNSVLVGHPSGELRIW